MRNHHGGWGVIETIIEPDLKAQGIHALTIPSIFPTGDTSCFLAEGDTGWTIIEAGVHTPQAREKWMAALKELGISFKQIDKILVTHIHPDHAGIAGWLQQQSDAQVLVPRFDLPAWSKYTLPEADHYEHLYNEMAPQGISNETIWEMVRDLAQINRFNEPYPEVTAIEEGNIFSFGDETYRVFPAPGHSDGHLMFLGEKHQWLFSGDAFLAEHVSQISDWPYSALEDPLTENLKALNRIVKLEPAVILPTHGSCFTGAGQRLEQIEDQHGRRLNKVLEKLTGEMTLIEVCQAINVKARVLQEFRVSWADTRAYLECLWRRGLIDKDLGEIIRYRPKADM